MIESPITNGLSVAMDIAANKARRPVNDSSGRSQALPCRELIAGIAIPARPSRVDFLAEVFENESRAAAGGLTELDYRVELGLIPGAAIFVVDEICGEINRREVVAQPLPVVASVFSSQSVLLEQG